MNRREFCFSVLCATVLGTVLSVASVGCLISGFSLEAGSILSLTLLCGCAALTSAVAFRFRWGGPGLLCLLAVMGAVLVWRSELVDQTLGLAEKITKIYHNAYRWGFLSLGGSTEYVLPLRVGAVLIAVTVGASVSTGSSPWTAVTASLIPVLLCVVVTDTVPEARWLFFLMAGLAILILTGSVRAKAAGQGNLLTAMVAVPVLLAVGLLLLLNPKEDYVNHTGTLQAKVEMWVEQLPQRLAELPLLLEEMQETGDNKGTPELSDTVDLRDVGPRAEQTFAVMDVFGTVDGPLYLRGQDYDFYTGTGWSATHRPQENFPGSGSVLKSAGAVTVETHRLRDVLYLPYYPMEQQALVSGRAYNTEGLRRYAVTVGIPVAQEAGPLTPAQENADRQAKSLYLNLPENTASIAREILGSLQLEGKDRHQQAQIIRQFVLNSAEYDLNTPKMPRNAGDFALWFLENGDRGYCVHFATAAVVLLRAADIPARYVTGYLAQAVPGETVTVTADSAHAWAEYYDPAGDTWIPLEATPSRGQIPETEETTEPAATETLPEQTQATEGTEEVPETTPSSEATEAPTQPPELPPEEKPDPLPRWIRGVLIWLGILGALTALTVGQRKLRLAWRQRRLREENPNKLALKLWQEAVLLTRLLGKARPPRALERLAQKAKFSQHTLTPEELETLRVYLTESLTQLQERAWYMQLIYRYVYVIY